MVQDGIAPFHQAMEPVQPRQGPGADIVLTPSTSISSASRTISTFGQVPTNTANVTSAHLSHAPFSTLTQTQDLDLGPEPCTAGLPAGGIIQFNDTYTLFLEESVSYVARCSNQTIFFPNSTNATVLESKDPFYASISPQVYALATATVISYILVILIFITPRTFYVGGPASSGGTIGPTSGLRTLFPGSVGRNNGVIGIGRRPLLQKIAALTVTVSLTIATADTFRVNARQYDQGFMDSKQLVQDVVGSLEIRITRVISDTFLWLAQVQTLIRLFPRHKEKVTIKWLGFGLVLCDTVFSIAENFVSKSNRTSPDSRTDAIPAISYLFEMAISLIYASCVLYYALSKRQFAFWHAKMRNVCLVALLSIIAVLIPVVFFVTDLAQPGIATWGEYIRWVGSAAASVVVWEWVERIEALERDEKKDGILGREIFDGDEMLDMTPSEDGFDDDRPHRLGKEEEQKRSRFWKNVRDLHIDIQPKIPLRKWKKKGGGKEADKTVTSVEQVPKKLNSNPITRPLQAATPISRSDTNSAASTVYAVRYHDPFSPSPAIPEDRAVDERRESNVPNVPPAISDESTLTNSTSTTMEQSRPSIAEPTQGVSTGRQMWQGVSNPFKRKRTEPPAEVAAQIAESNSRRSPIDGHLNLRHRINAFTAAQKGKLGGRSQKNRTPLGVTFIPAQPRASRANMETNNRVTDTDDGSPNAAVVAGEPSRTQDEPESDFGSPDLAALPITVIPAPVRGGRTWSPDDMVHEEQETPPPPRQHQQNQTPNLHFGEQPADLRFGVARSPHTIHSQRGALTISESPGRIRDANSPSGGTSSAMRRARNNRSTTITSISDRIDSTSPTALSRSSGSRSANTNPSASLPSIPSGNTSGQSPEV